MKVVLTDDKSANHGVIQLDSDSNQVVKVIFDAKPSIRDTEFKEFIRIKQ